MPKTTSANIDTDGLAKIIHDFPHHEFIFQYNDNTKAAIEKMHNTGAKFSLLFDASGVAKRKDNLCLLFQNIVITSKRSLRDDPG